MVKSFLSLILCLSIVLLSGCNQPNAVKEKINLVTESSEGSKENTEDGVADVKVPTAEPTENTGVRDNDNSGETVDAIELESSQHDTSGENSDGKIKDIYVGEYNDYDVDEPNLQIQKNENGTYTIQIGIFRLVSLDDGIGTLTEKGIEFTATAPNGEELTGTIVVEGDIAVVTFTNEVWATYSPVKEYRYHKTSEIPNIYP